MYATENRAYSPDRRDRRAIFWACNVAGTEVARPDQSLIHAFGIRFPQPFNWYVIVFLFSDLEE